MPLSAGRKVPRRVPRIWTAGWEDVPAAFVYRLSMVLLWAQDLYSHGCIGPGFVGIYISSWRVLENNENNGLHGSFQHRDGFIDSMTVESCSDTLLRTPPRQPYCFRSRPGAFEHANSHVFHSQCDPCPASAGQCLPVIGCWSGYLVVVLPAGRGHISC